MADLSSGGQGDEPANKRARLESVIPTPATAGKKEAAKNQLPTPPPRPCPPPLWLTGQLPAAHRGRGWGNRQLAAIVVPVGAAKAPTKAANTAAGAAGDGATKTQKVM